MLRNIQCRTISKSAQTMVEYLLMVAAVIAITILVMRPGGLFTSSLNQTLQSSTSVMNAVATDVFDDMSN